MRGCDAVACCLTPMATSPTGAPSWLRPPRGRCTARARWECPSAGLAPRRRVTLSVRADRPHHPTGRSHHGICAQASSRRYRCARRQPSTRHDAATGAAAGAAGSGLLLVARIIRAITWGVVAIIVAAILFKVFEATRPTTSCPRSPTGAPAVGPFKDLFSIDNAKTAVAVNWGLAALVYLIVGSLIARVFARGASPASGRANVGRRTSRGHLEREVLP